MFLIGSLFLGKVDRVKDHWIETKFVIIGVPIVPVSSMVVTRTEWRQRAGFNIPLNKKSIIAGYGRVFSFLLAAACIGLWFTGGGADIVVLAICFIAGWIYFYFAYGKTGSVENLERIKLGTITGLYILPEWLNHEDAYSIYEHLDKKYTQAFPDCDWLADLQAEEVDKQKLPLLYALARYNYTLGSTDSNKQLLDNVSVKLNNSVGEEAWVAK